VRTDRLDAAVWEQARSLLSQPDRLRAEYDRRVRVAQSGEGTQERSVMEARARKLRTAIGRLIDAYAEGLIEKGEFEPRISRLKERLTQAEEQERRLAEEAAQVQEMTLLVSRLDAFAASVQQRLDEVDWETQRTLIRTLVKQVTIDREEVHIVFRINPDTLPAPPTDASLHDCWGRDHPALGCPTPAARSSAPVPLPRTIPFLHRYP
jgi:site-specific DNA recombinase